MKRTMLKAACLLLAAAVFAGRAAAEYNPPYGGNDLFRLTNPELLSGAASASGGANFFVLPASMAYNPALPAGEQRVSLDVSGTLFFNHGYGFRADGDPFFGGGGQLGVLIPTKALVVAAQAGALFANFDGMDLGNTLILRAGVSKEVFDKISLGVDIYGGIYMGRGSTDWSLGADIGVLYKFGDLGFFKDSRLGVAALNLGKTASRYNVTGIWPKSAHASGYPSGFTPRVSFASTLIRDPKASLSFSADLSFPFVQNVVLDLGLGASFSDVVRVSLSWQANLAEFMAGYYDDYCRGINTMSLGVSVKLGVNTGAISRRHADWERSEITPSLATQTLYSGIQAVSFGARLDLGTRDTEAPEIFLWDEEDSGSGTGAAEQIPASAPAEDPDAVNPDEPVADFDTPLTEAE